jgi:CRP-like cAMP-binding protein
VWGDAGLRSLLPADAWQALLSQGRRRAYEKGDRLIAQGDDDTTAIVLVEGRVKVTWCDEDGTEVLLAVRGPGDVVGERAAIDGGVRSASVTALSRCVVRVLSRHELVDFVDRRDLWLVMLNLSVSRQREGQSMLIERTTMQVGRRLARFLLRLAGATEPRGDDAMTIDLGLPQEELARAIGASRSQVTDCLKQMRDEGILLTRNRCIVILDPEGLRTFDTRRSAARCESSSAAAGPSTNRTRAAS